VCQVICEDESNRRTAKEVADIIRNGPKGHVSATFTFTILKPAHLSQKELEDLNNRCIARLSSLQDLEAASMPLDDRTITRFLDETEMYYCCIKFGYSTDEDY
jgi:hypothetical protein